MTNYPSRSENAPTEIASPWNDFDRFFDDLTHRLDVAFGPGFAVPRAFGARATLGAGPRAARTDVVDTGPSFRLTADVPGVPKERLEVTILGPNVEIRSTESTDSETQNGEYLHRERVARAVYRAVVLPEPVVAEKATAKLVDGVLELDLPKQTPTPAPAQVKVPVQ